MSIRSNIDSRRFDQRITIQRKLELQDPNSGYVTHTWSTVATVWAAVDALKANERLEAAKLNQVNSYTAWIRADVMSRYSLDTNMRVVWRGEPYDIKDIPDNQLRGGLVALFLIGGLSQGQ